MVISKIQYKSKKTVLKTMRIPDYINSLLEKDADSKGVSVNALISMIMTKYAEWDRYIERFGGITIKPQAFKEILEVVDEDKLADIAKRSGSRFPKEFILFLVQERISIRISNHSSYCVSIKDMPVMRLRVMGQNIL